MASCTIFKNFAVAVENKSLIIIANWIASDKYKTEVEKIQSLIAGGNEEEATKLKQQLPAFTPSATFKEKRLLTHIESYSGFVHLDFDKLTPQQLENAFKIISAIPYTFLCFRSPSGNGLKVFVEVNTGQEHHALAYRQVQQLYEEKLGIASDPKCKDITRLCFMSYHPELYKNIGNEEFSVNLSVTPPPPPAVETIVEEQENDFTEAMQQCVAFTEKVKTYSEGNRNEFIYVLASNCNRKGIPENIALQYCLTHYDLPEKEIKASFRSAYTHHSSEFAKFANAAKSANQPGAEQQQQQQQPREDYLKNTPTIPQSIYDALPDILKEGASAFTDDRKRDVFFTGALAILSGCLPKVTGIYFNERIHPHLFTFIIAPAASGKGVLKNAKKLADKYHQQKLQASRDEQKGFEAEMADYKEILKSKKKGDTAPEKPQEPLFKIVYIPADCSQARMIDHLHQNDGFGIICETEADTMSGAKKQDWGDYSPILRSAFHHEKISFSRKTNNEFIEIPEPCLAVALTGTPAQAPRLISSAEDGLFSRFLFYAFKVEQVWQDPSPTANTIVYNDHFEQLSNKVMEQIEFLNQSPTNVLLHPDQWKILNSSFADILAEVTLLTSEDAAGIVYRLGLILFRMCMIFTALRKCENAELTDNVYCTDEDFNIALSLAKIYLQHSILMFNNLPKQTESSQFKTGDNKRSFFKALPAEFARHEAVAIGSKYGMAARTVDDLLNSLLNTHLAKPKPGHYCKINP